MEILGTNFTLSLGSWRLRFVLAIEEADSQPARKVTPRIACGSCRRTNTCADGRRRCGR